MQPQPPIPEELLEPQLQVPRGRSLAVQMPNWDSHAVALLGVHDDQYLTWRLATVIVRSGDHWGSGAIISGDGWILTSYRVVESAVQDAAIKGQVGRVEVIIATEHRGAVVPLSANHPTAAQVYRVDLAKDLALLKLDSVPNEHDGQQGVTLLDGHGVLAHWSIAGQAGQPVWTIGGGAGVTQRQDYGDIQIPSCKAGDCQSPTASRCMQRMVLIRRP